MNYFLPIKPAHAVALCALLMITACGDKGVMPLEDNKTVQQKEQLIGIQSVADAQLMQQHIVKAKVAVGAAYQQPIFFSPENQVPASNTENYTHNEDNPIHLVSAQPVSTFSIDVDTASYANVRRLLNQGALPPADAVRIEEMINYFSYDYPLPEEGPFSVYTEVGSSPYNANKQLIHIGIQADKMEAQKRPAANLVFLLDVSGSMHSANKLGLLKSALTLLTKQLNADDRVSIVVYAGATGVVLEPTAGDNDGAIIDALTRLSAGGSTNGGAGIELAYRLAADAFIKDGINRVILATDGDFNVGAVSQQALKEKIKQQRKTGVSLSILGFGRGNYNDALMQTLAQNGNGNAFYIDTLNEARKVLVEELSSTLVTVAKDVKIQIEFNPNIVREYRLIGYETRALKREDFNNDKVDAGDIGAGHTVTAIYEISLQDATEHSIDPLRYQSEQRHTSDNNIEEIAFLKLRYKLPEQDKSILMTTPIKRADIKTSLSATSETFQFSAAVAGFAQLLRGSDHLALMDIDTLIALAQQSKGADKHGYRSEFINMLKLTDALTPTVNNK